MNIVQVYITGNLTRDPELRFTGSGTAVTNFSVAATPRKFNQQTKQWEDEEPTYLPCTAWRDTAENIAESCRKGDRVFVSGSLRQKTWEDDEGNKRTNYEVVVDECAVTLRFASVGEIQRNSDRDQKKPQKKAESPKRAERGSRPQRPSRSRRTDPEPDADEEYDEEDPF